MVTAKVRITFESDSKALSVFEQEVEFTDLREPGGDEFVAQYLLSELKKESRWGSYFLDLPDVQHLLRPVKQSFRLEDIFSTAYDDRSNTRAMWMEMGNTLLRAKALLAKARAYHDVEQEQRADAGPETENLAWHIHLDKMDNFDLGVLLLGKVSDLAARLIFERLGASLVPNLDRSNPEWEREVTWTNIRRGFADRSGNPHVAALTDSEYKTVQGILDDFLSGDHGTRLWAYRLKFVHRITPSVDHPELYTHLQSRENDPIVDETGQTRGWEKKIESAPTSAEYSFLALYEDAAQTLRHYICMLKRLEAIPRFSPEAAAKAA